MRFSTLAFFSSIALTVSARTWDELHAQCTPVSIVDLDAFGNNQTALGPKGLYGSTPRGDCIYTDASADSLFAKEEPERYGAFIKSIEASGIPTNQLEFLQSTEKRAKTGTLAARSGIIAARDCGNICDGSNVNRVDCMDISCTHCTITSQFCDGTSCWYFAQCVK